MNALLAPACIAAAGLVAGIYFARRHDADQSSFMLAIVMLFLAVACGTLTVAGWVWSVRFD